MRQLKLVRIAQELPLLLQDASKREASYAELLQDLLGRELSAKQDRHAAMKTTMARFPFQKSLESFDFKIHPSIEPMVICELAAGRFIADADNVLLLGPPARLPGSESRARFARASSPWPAPSLHRLRNRFLGQIRRLPW
ncbi:MAG: ATP-binding protein [Thermoanaerobaculia bacterium]